MKQHISTVNSNSAPKTALAILAKENSHQFNFNELQILERNNFKQILQICEVNHITFHPENACNFKSDSTHISPTYYNLLRHHVNKSNIILPAQQQYQNLTTPIT